MVMIRVPTLTDQNRQDHARVLIMACRLHPPPPACRDGHRILVSMRESLEGLLTDPRKPRGKRHPLPSPVSVMVAGVASGHGGAQAVAQAVAQAASWDQDVLAGHGCRISPRTGLRVPPSASMLDRLPRLLDADEFEAAPSAYLAQAALDPAIPAAYSCPPPKTPASRTRSRPSSSSATPRGITGVWPGTTCIAAATVRGARDRSGAARCRVRRRRLRRTGRSRTGGSPRG